MNIGHQEIKQQWRQQVQKIRHPMAYCQACLGQKQYKDDPIITCGICESSIHKSHYAYEIVGKNTNRNHLTHNLDDWRCQRCRTLVEKKFSIEIKCEFCPFPRGIMKKVMFEWSANHKKEIWVHPQCTTWGYPLVWIKDSKRTHYFKETTKTATTKFWFRVEDQPNRKCLLCSDSYGYKIKCTFYSCQKYYHTTCAKKIGVIRDLESMRFDPNGDDYNQVYCPVYCEEHLQAYVLDFGNRVKLYTEKKDSEKLAHFTKVHNCYKIQLKNMTTSAKRAKQEQQIRNQFGKQLMIGGFEESSMSLSLSEPRSNQMNSSDSESHSSTFLTFLEQKYDLKDLDKLLMMKKSQYSKSEDMALNKVTVNQMEVNKVKERKQDKKRTKRQNKNKSQSNESISQQDDRIIQEERGQSMDIEESIEQRGRIIENERIGQVNQIDEIVEEKEVLVEEKYMEGAYQQAKGGSVVQVNEWMRGEQVKLIPLNEMGYEGNNSQNINSEKKEMDEEMVEESLDQIAYHFPKQPNHINTKSQRQLSEQLMLQNPLVRQQRQNQTHSGQCKEKHAIGYMESVRNQNEKMEEENDIEPSERAQNPQQLQLQDQQQLNRQTEEKGATIINTNPGTIISTNTNPTTNINTNPTTNINTNPTTNINANPTSNSKKKSRPYIEQQLYSPSSPEISDQSYNPHR